MSIKVTVYITCFNYAIYVQEAIESVFKQTFKNWELIIIDDNSSDHSQEVIKQIVEKRKDKKIKCVFNNKNKGLPYCANLAIDSSSKMLIHKFLHKILGF